MEYEYTHLEDFFSLSDWTEDIKGPFGLRDSHGGWSEFEAHIDELNRQCPKDESIKLIYAARHGQGEHNTLSAKYGQPDDVVMITHPILDPSLTPLGRSQAADLATALQREAKKGMPLPEKWFVSPLRRTGETCGIEWGWVLDDGTPGERGMSHGVPAIVIENIREHLHVHLCDKRLTLSELKPLFPSFTYPTEMTDEDVLWKGEDESGRENEEEIEMRTGRGIGEILNRSGEATYLSITSHSGALRGIFACLGVPPRRLDVGEMNVLVIRVKQITK